MAIFRTSRMRVHDSSYADSVAAILMDRLGDVKRTDFEAALWVGAGDRAAISRIKTIKDLAMRPFPVEGDIEYFPYAEASLNLLVVNGTLHTINDLPGVLVQMRRALKPDGLFLGALSGGESLFELRESLMRVESQLSGGAGMRVHPVVDLQTFAGLMQRAGFALPVSDSEVRTIYYRQFKTLLRDIKAAGEGLALIDRPRPYPGRHFWPAVEADYKAHHMEADGLLRASFEVIYAIGWGPAESQPKPLRPGSAKHSMAEALGGIEGALPDKARP